MRRTSILLKLDRRTSTSLFQMEVSRFGGEKNLTNQTKDELDPSALLKVKTDVDRISARAEYRPAFPYS